MFGDIGLFAADMVLPGLGGVIKGPDQIHVPRYRDEISKVDREQETLLADQTKSREELDRQEAEYRTQLDKEQGEAFSSVDEQTARLLEQAGIMGQMARSQTGSSMADRGLLRSSFTGQALNKVNLAEQQNKSNVRLQGAETKQEIQGLTEDAKQRITHRRQQLEQQRLKDKLADNERRRVALHESRLRMQLDEELSTMGIKAQDKEMLFNNVGNFFSGAAKLAGSIV